MLRGLTRGIPGEYRKSCIHVDIDKGVIGEPEIQDRVVSILILKKVSFENPEFKIELYLD